MSVDDNDGHEQNDSCGGYADDDIVHSPYQHGQVSYCNYRSAINLQKISLIITIHQCQLVVLILNILCYHYDYSYLDYSYYLFFKFLLYHYIITICIMHFLIIVSTRQCHRS